MHHLLSILATLSLAAATPLPQYDSLTTPDIVTGDPWGTTSLDTTNTNTYIPTSPFLLAETQRETSPTTKAPDNSPAEEEPTNWSRHGDSSWTGSGREVDSSRGGFPKLPNMGNNSPESDKYWSDRGFPRLPAGNAGNAVPSPVQDTGLGAAAAGAVKVFLDGVPSLNLNPQRGY